ncbi:MAG: hypothetical protein K5654_07930 [Lachnospiraceae bacterium]|nr:hypothetical protein [Lachnospiraceae bacterium]
MIILRKKLLILLFTMPLYLFACTLSNANGDIVGENEIPAIEVEHKETKDITENDSTVLIEKMDDEAVIEEEVNANYVYKAYLRYLEENREEVEVFDSDGVSQLKSVLLFDIGNDGIPEMIFNSYKQKNTDYYSLMNINIIVYDKENGVRIIFSQGPYTGPGNGQPAAGVVGTFYNSLDGCICLDDYSMKEEKWILFSWDKEKGYNSNCALKIKGSYIEGGGDYRKFYDENGDEISESEFVEKKSNLLIDENKALLSCVAETEAAMTYDEAVKYIKDMIEE